MDRRPHLRGCIRRRFERPQLARLEKVPPLWKENPHPQDCGEVWCIQYGGLPGQAQAGTPRNQANADTQKNPTPAPNLGG